MKFKRVPTKSFIAIILFLLLMPNLAFAQENCGVPFLQERMSSDKWQLRYGVIFDITGRSDDCRSLLVRLIEDSNKSVSNQAMEKYLNQFVIIDHELILKHLEKLNPIPVGSFKDSQRTDIRSATFYINWINIDEINDPNNGRNIMFVGIVGDKNKGDVNFIKGFAASKNDYVLLETAKAMIRLGEVNEGLKIIDVILNKDVQDHLHYQTQALHVLAEINREKYHSEYLKLKAKVDRVSDIQPNWMNEFYILGLTEKIVVEK